MADTNTTDRHSRALIDDIEPTTDKLTGRAGLSLFTRYLRGIEIFSHLDRLFGSLRQRATHPGDLQAAALLFPGRNEPPLGVLRRVEAGRRVRGSH